MSGLSHKSTQPQPPLTSQVATQVFSFSDQTCEQLRNWNRDVNHAREALSAKRVTEGVRRASQCLQQAPSLFPDPTPQLITCYILLGQLHCESKQYSLALEAFAEALSLCSADRKRDDITVTLLGNIAAIHAETGNPQEAIPLYERRLALLEDMAERTSLQHYPVRERTIETLKELSGLSLKLGDPHTAERYAYSLAALQDRGCERGKTFVLLSRIYLANGRREAARDAAVLAQHELHAGEAEHHHPLSLATAHRLEARLLLDRKLFEHARISYETAHSILHRAFGPQDIRTVLCGCDIAIVDTLLDNYLSAAKAFNELLPQAEQLVPAGSNDPALRPYIWSGAGVEHKLGVELLMAYSNIEALPPWAVTLSSVNRVLEDAGLHAAWEGIFQQFIRGIERQSLLSSLKQAGEEHLHHARSRYIQVVVSLQNEFKSNDCIHVATVFDRMSSLSFALQEDDWGRHYRKKANFIRSKHNQRGGGNLP